MTPVCREMASFDYRHFLHLIVENDRQVVADVSGSKGVKFTAAPHW